MRKSRYLAPWQSDPADLEAREEDADKVAEAMDALRGTPAVYHCVSRIVNRELLLQREDKEKLVSLMRLYEEFCQLRVLTFCVLSSHVHILVEVPTPPDDEGASWSDEKLLNHLSLLYSEEQMAEIRLDLENRPTRKGADGVEDPSHKYLERMWDLSFFMKVIKQRFTQWFNPRHERRGVLWEDRFKNVLVEPGHAARMMAAYIDLNPLRAGLVEDPKEYRWSGYGEAVAGKKNARAGLQRVMSDISDPAGQAASWRETARNYRAILSGHDGESGERPPRSREELAGVIAEGGEMSEGELLRCRARQFSEGLVFGSEEFVNRVFVLTRTRFGPKRRTGARKLRHVSTNLRTMRDIQLNRYSV